MYVVHDAEMLYLVYFVLDGSFCCVSAAFVAVEGVPRGLCLYQDRLDGEVF